MKAITTILFGAAVLLATVSLTSCTDDPSPSLTLTPVEFGGEHASLLSTMTGDSFAYRVQYDGDATGYRINIELFESGELTTNRQLLAVTFADFPENWSQDLLLAFLVTDPRRDGEPTEITAALSGPIMSFHKDIQIAEWDALGGGGARGGHHERMHFKSTSEPIVLYRWWQGSHHSSLTDPRAKESRVCMQLTLHLEK